MKKYVSEIFIKDPEHWGLRGDPFLWKDLQKLFKNQELPYSENLLEEDIKTYILHITNEPLITSKKQLFVKKYDLGGMSSGYISCEFWLNIAIPLLKKRIKLLNKIINF